MKNYFLISEFAKLRGININSLRYYEKLGILKPAYIDERTNYRYYSVEQISLLNKIILCIQLGISLKEMATYIDENGELQSQKLLEQGRVIAQKRIKEMENNLKYIENSLNSIEVNKEFAGKEGKYIRKIEARRVLTTDCYYGSPDIKKFVSEISEIYKIAQKNDLYPILPAGQIIDLDESGKMTIRFFLEVLNCEEDDDINFSDKSMKIETIPAGEYSCIRTELGPNIDLENLICSNWGKEEKITVIMDNVVAEKYSFGKSISEMQRLEKPFPV